MELKFRAWNKPDKVMITDLNSPVMMHGVLLVHSDDVIMQFTGLTDKNGKDIYEGDLITNGSGRIGRVLWHDISGSWDSEAQNSDGSCVGFHTYHWKDCIEVIGNIHQHSHLLGGNNNA